MKLNRLNALERTNATVKHRHVECDPRVARASVQNTQPEPDRESERFDVRIRRSPRIFRVLFPQTRDKPRFLPSTSARDFIFRRI